MSFIDNVKKTTGTIGSVIKRTYGPLEPLELPFNRGNIYRYPLDVATSSIYPHTIEFQTWLPDPVGLTELEPFQATARGAAAAGSAINKATGGIAGKVAGAVGGALNKVAGAVNKVETAFQNKTGINLFDLNPTPAKPSGSTTSALPTALGGPRVNTNQKYNNRNMDFTRRATPSDLIVLYLPAGNWQDAHKNQYEGKSMTEAWGAAGVVNELGTSAAEGFKESDGLVNKVLGAISSAAKSPVVVEKGSEVLGKILGGDGGAIAQVTMQSMGVAVNPQLEMLYGGTDFRTFQFEFILTPRDRKEADSIKEIIRKFKYHASPAFRDDGAGRFITPPSYFDITMKFNGSPNPYLPRISTCALTDITIQYNNGLDQWASFEDGAPIQATMTLQFTELEMMHKELRKQGY